MPPSDRHLQQSLPSVMHHVPRPPERRLGPWELLAELGRGSNGVVYRARREGLQGEVALKVLPDAVRQDPMAIVRFRQEAELGRRLDHPGIVRTLDVGDAGPHAWYAMELVPGETLAARLRRGKLPVADATALVLTLARAMAHAHAHRVVHRDLKPANVILSPAGPRITDLGLARDQDRVRALTRTGDLLGTPLYMAPEQLQGVRGVDGRVDVWALGVLLFECVSGDRPFHASDPLGLARRITQEDAPLLRSVAPQASAALEAVVRKALTRAPDARFPDAGALAAALEPLVLADRTHGAEGRGAEDSRASGSGSGEGPARSARGVGVPVAALACVVALAAVAGAVVVARRPAAAPGQAVATDRRSASSASDRRSASSASDRAPPPEGAPPRAPELDAALESALRGLLAAATAEPRAAEDARARALAVADGAPADAGARQAVEEAGVRAAAVALDAVTGLAASEAPLEALLARLDVARVLAPADAATLRRADRLRARHLHRRARYPEAAAAARALVEASPAGSLDDAGAEGLSILARMNDQEAAVGDPDALARLAESGPEPWRTWAAGLQLLEGARSLADLARVEEKARAALARDPDFPPARELLARALYQRSRGLQTSEALDVAEAAVDRAREAAPDDVHVELWGALARFDRRDYEGKVRLLSRAIALSEPTPHRRSLFWRAHTLYALRRHEEARRDLERLVQLRADDVEAALWRALLWSLTSELPRAQAEWRRLVHTYPAQVDALLAGGSSVETQPIMDGVTRALIDGARRATTPMATPRRALAARLEELAARSSALAPWREVAEALALAEEEAAGQDRDGRDLVLLERGRACFRRGRMQDARAAAAQVAGPGGARRAALEARFLEAISWLWGGDVRRGLDLLGALHADDEGPVGCSAGMTWNSYLGRNLLGALLGQAALAIEPGAVEPSIGLGFCLNDLGQTESGVEAVDGVLRRVPDHPRALMAKAMLATNLGRIDDALEALDRVVKLTEPEPIVRALLQRGELRLRLASAGGEPDGARLTAALQDADRAVARAPQDVQALCLRALVRLLLGRDDEAAADLQEAARVDPAQTRGWLERVDPRQRGRLGALLRRR